MAKVIVAGAMATDALLVVDHQPRAGEEIASRELKVSPGGKGINQAVAAARTGAEVLMIGCIGHDAFAQRIIDFLHDEHIGTCYVHMLDGSPTDLAFITIDPSGERTIVYYGQCMPRLSLDGLEMVIEEGDVLISQAELPTGTITEYFTRGRGKGSRNLLNAAPARPLDVVLLRLADIIVVNAYELAVLTARPLADPDDRAAVEAAAGVLRASAEQIVITTLGAHGALICQPGATTYVEALPVQTVDTTGAGDAFVGSLGALLCLGWPIEQAVRYACAAGSLAATRLGAGPAMPGRAEVEAALG